MAEIPNLPEAPAREFHAVADLFPLMRGAAFEELVADIKKNGLREPILIDGEGRILDGRNRYRACLAAGVEPRFIEWKGEEPLAELALSLNLRRRHLNESQRAMVAARLAKMMEGEAMKRRGRRQELAANLRRTQPRRSCGEAAATVNVSRRLVEYATKVLRDGSDELVAVVESGGLAVSTASILSGLPKDEQAKALAGGAKQAAARAREIRAAKSTAFTVERSSTRLRVFRPEVSEENETTVVLLWVAARNLAAVVEALKAHGFQYTDAGGDSRLPS